MFLEPKKGSRVYNIYIRMNIIIANTKTKRTQTRVKNGGTYIKKITKMHPSMVYESGYSYTIAASLLR